MDDVGDEVDVALPAASPGVDAERLLHGEAQEQQFDVVHVELVRGLPLPRALLEVRVVSAKERGNLHRAPPRTAQPRARARMAQSSVRE